MKEISMCAIGLKPQSPSLSLPLSPLNPPSLLQEVNFCLIRWGEEPSLLLRSVERLLSGVCVAAVKANPSGQGMQQTEAAAGLDSCSLRQLQA